MLVPREPTPEMLRASRRALGDLIEGMPLILIGASFGCFVSEWEALVHPVAPLLLSLGFGFAAMWALSTSTR